MRHALQYSGAIAALSALFALPVAAHPVTFIGTLSGGAENPVNGSLGTGPVTVIFDDDTFTMRVEVSFSGLTGNVTASHIHCCTTVHDAGNAGVATRLPTFLDFPLGGTSGTYDKTFDMTLSSSWNPAFVSAQGGISNAFAALSTGLNSGTSYLNIHTNVVPGGEIRAFLHAAPVPEPATHSMLLLGLAGVGALARRRA